ncbi:MAG: alanine--glyoxylate aminotransferase family protein [Dehalococcoidia bacterium]|nr:alanine--glyoxylate aminotransferase family protein [Dehalococcoidia bacterium]
MQLRVPGPTPCPPRVLDAMTRQMINHRGKEFAEILQSTTGLLQQFFNTKNDVYVLTASGTGGMEAAVVNTLSPGDPVLAVTTGYFGERLANMAGIYGAQVTRLDFPWGHPADPDAVSQALQNDPGIKAVLMVHNETSTGVTNPLPQLCQVVKEFDKLLVVDGISSMGSLEFKVDEWGIDVAITASQKGWMAPPGLAMISFSPRAWEAHACATMPRFYWDLALAKRFLNKGQTPFTPAVSTLYAMLAALELMAEEGQQGIIDRHQRVADATRKGVKVLGLSLLPPEEFASNTVSAVLVPQGLDTKQLQRLMAQQDVILSGGQGALEGRIFRIGHLGWVTEEDVQIVLKALESVLPRAGFVRTA